ncbi:MAG TPA: UDP-N-acetylmuramoyl-L-alanine--D-glutamate ligase [Candidatus Saccharimonadales bacterium]|jgi:UDP-N-acetylmuramoylalanine--D-glutamate ligase
MKIAILGYGLQGRSAYDYWKSNDNQITVCDINQSLELPADITPQLGPNHLHELDQYDLIVRSPIVHPHDIVAANSPEILRKVTTVTNEFMNICPTRNIIGVTGTKGKGTTSTMIADMLAAAGKTVHLGGNIGTPPLDLLKNGIQPDDWVVLELANFQLIDLKVSPMIGVCLMVVPEHLNWHADMAEYVAAKQQLFVWQTFDDIAIYYHRNEYSVTIAGAGNGAKLPYFAAPGAVIDEGCISIGGQIICHTDELQLLGEHNWQNACAAVTAAWQITHSVTALRSVLTTFTGLEHRLEHVRELHGVNYYDDSFGTTPETAIVAIQAFAQPKVIILGGSDKAADYSELAAIVKKCNVRKVVLIGDQAPRLQAALEAATFTDFVAGGSNMDEIVQTARSAAQPGDVVLLSTACASFDMFKDYKDRGDKFTSAVEKLSTG